GSLTCTWLSTRPGRSTSSSARVISCSTATAGTEPRGRIWRTAPSSITTVCGEMPCGVRTRSAWTAKVGLVICVWAPCGWAPVSFLGAAWGKGGSTPVGSVLRARTLLAHAAVGHGRQCGGVGSGGHQDLGLLQGTATQAGDEHGGQGLGRGGFVDDVARDLAQVGAQAFGGRDEGFPVEDTGGQVA